MNHSLRGRLSDSKPHWPAVTVAAGNGPSPWHWPPAGPGLVTPPVTPGRRIVPWHRGVLSHGTSDSGHPTVTVQVGAPPARPGVASGAAATGRLGMERPLSRSPGARRASVTVAESRPTRSPPARPRRRVRVRADGGIGASSSRVSHRAGPGPFRVLGRPACSLATWYPDLSSKSPSPGGRVFHFSCRRAGPRAT